MKTWKMKQVVVGILLVILTLGFCVVGTGAARPDGMGRPPMGQENGFGGRGFDGQTPPELPDGENTPGGDSGFDGQTPPEMPDGENAPDGDGGFGGRGGRGGRFSPDGQTPPDCRPDSDGQGFSGSHGGRGGQRGFGPLDQDSRAAIEALEDDETKSELLKLLENVHTAMEALRAADDDSRESAEAAVKEARDALNAALTAAGIETAMKEPPEKPADDNGMTPPERPEGDNGMTLPEKPESTAA